jgi:hypothetical protein
MAIEVLKCPNCGAPIPPEAGATYVCAYCNHVLTGVPVGARRFVDPWRGRPEDEGRPRVMAAGVRYVLQGRLGVGDGCDVFLARRDARLTELTVLKVLRARADADLLAREWDTLAVLHASATQGAEHFTRRLPQPVAHGRIFAPGAAARPVSVFRYQSGFVHTLDDVVRAYPDGVEPPHAVWLWKRMLELLGWVHACGYVHGAVLPAHLLVHARDHGLLLVGWSAAVATGRSLATLSAGARAYYPASVWGGGPATPATDLAMSARCVLRVLGGDVARGEVPGSVPPALSALLSLWLDPDPAAARGASAWAVKAELDRVAREAFGPPRYHRLRMPGW